MKNSKRMLVGSACAILLMSMVQVARAQCVENVNGDTTEPYCTTLYAGQTIDAGTVCAEIVGSDLEVTFGTAGGWELTEAHLWVGSQISDMPQTKTGNPKIGNFPYNSGDITGLTSYTFAVPLSSFGFSCPGPNVTYIMAAHAALRKDLGDGTYQTETGWGNGPRMVQKGSWATYTEIQLSCDCGGGGPNDSCETAYGTTCNAGEIDSCGISACFPLVTKGDHCGEGSGDPLSAKWGWQLGPIPAGTLESYNLHAGGGGGQHNCDTNHGYVAGSVFVDYDGSNLTVTYDVTAGGTELGKTHVYTGYDGACTSAPGQFTVLGSSGENDSCDKTSSTQTWGGFNGDDIYVILHAEICPSTNYCD